MIRGPLDGIKSDLTLLGLGSRCRIAEVVVAGHKAKRRDAAARVNTEGRIEIGPERVDLNGTAARRRPLPPDRLAGPDPAQLFGSPGSVVAL